MYNLEHTAVWGIACKAGELGHGERRTESLEGL
jgi:hypothetical protein